MFDFDGTIGDTFRQGFEILNALADEYNYRRLDESEIEYARDMTTRQLMKFLGISARKLPSISMAGTRELKKRLATVKPIEGVPNVLHALHRRGTHVGIVTSNTEENVAEFLRVHDLEIFRFVCSSSRLFGKAREIRALMKANRYEPHEVVLVGDETRDIEAARRAGIRMAAVLWGFNSRRALEAQAPDYLLGRPEELLSAFPLAPAGVQASE